MLLAAIAGRLARAVMQDMRHRVKQQHGLASVAALHAGVFTVVQRFRSDLGLYVHLHCLATDGAYEEQNDGALRFLAAPPPTPERMTAVLAQDARIDCAEAHGLQRGRSRLPGGKPRGAVVGAFAGFVGFASTRRLSPQRGSKRLHQLSKTWADSREFWGLAGAQTLSEFVKYDADLWRNASAYKGLRKSAQFFVEE